MSHRATHVSEITEVWQPTEPNEAAWKAVRHHFGIGAFGVNAFVARADGGDLIEPHEEAGAPVMLAALVTVQAVGGDREIVLDARLAGLGAAGIALWCRAGLLATMVAAGAAAALARLLV